MGYIIEVQSVINHIDNYLNLSLENAISFSVLINTFPLVISLSSTLNIPKRQKNMRHSRPLPAPNPKTQILYNRKAWIF